MELGDQFAFFVLVGLAAQLIDGALGMAFGLVSSTILLSLGVPPAAVSASVHTAEIFTTGASGLSHLVMGNIDKRLFWRLTLAGTVGGVLGAYGLTRFPAETIRPLIYAYLFLLSLLILVRALGRWVPKGPVRRVRLLGFVAGFLDASGGGGWGPVATSTLLAHGGAVRTTIGSVNAAEFLVTLSVSLTFLFTVGVQHLDVVLGLLVGGMVAAPLAALFVRHVRERWVLLAVGSLVMAISVYQIGQQMLGGD